MNDDQKVELTPADFEELSAEELGKRCALCTCPSVKRLFGFRVCEYHTAHGEGDDPCPQCAATEFTIPEGAYEVLELEDDDLVLIAKDRLETRCAAAQEVLDAAREQESDRWLAAKARFLEVVGYRVGDRAYLEGAGSGMLFAGEVVEHLEENELEVATKVRFRFDDRSVAVVATSELLPIVAELLVAAGEVLDFAPSSEARS